MLELNEIDTDICAMAEARKKRKGVMVDDEFILIYSAVRQKERSKASVGVLVHRNYMDLLERASSKLKDFQQQHTKQPKKKFI